MKDDLSQKSTWKYDIFFKCSKKMVFPKKSHWNMIFLVVLSGKVIYLFLEDMILFFRRKMKDDLSQKDTWKHDIFFKGPQMMVFLKRIALEFELSCIIWKDGIFFGKNTLKGDWHARLHYRKYSNDSLNFYGDVHRHFHILLSSEKNQETLYIRFKFDFFFNLFGWRYSKMKNPQ